MKQKLNILFPLRKEDILIYKERNQTGCEVNKMAAQPFSVIETKKKAAALAVLCFLIYASSYIGRLNYSAALTELIADQILTKAQGGMISTIYFAVYGAGQLVNGLLADRHDPMKQVLIGVTGSAVLNYLFLKCNTYGAMLIVWGLNGYVQALIWAPMFLLVSQHMSREFRPQALMLINMAPAAGTILGYLFSSLVLWQFPWQSLFTGAALVLAGGSVLWILGCKHAFRGARLAEEQTPEWKPSGNPVRLEREKLSRVVMLSGVGMLILPAMIQGMLKDGVTSWVPTYLTERFSLPPQIAVAVTILLPVVNILGAAGVYLFLRKIPNEATAMGVLFLCAGGGLLALQLVGQISALLSAGLLALVTAGMMSVNVIICSEVPLRFSVFGKSASVSGFMNACGYIGAAASMYGIAVLSERYGWTVTQWVWIGSCLLAAVLSLSVGKRWMEFRRKNWRCEHLR